MIQGKSVLGLIPARGGSKGVQGKNIRPVGGKPLLAWTIESAQASKYIDRLILSSDDERIIAVAKTYGCDVPFVRPSNLARDDSPGIDPVIHALQAIPGYDYVVLLQPTSPLRSSGDIDSAIELCLKENAPFCVSVTISSESPFWTFSLNQRGGLSPVVNADLIPTRRQDLPKTVILNGAVYVGHAPNLIKERTFLTTKTVAYEMPQERSLDIDSHLDFDWLEFLLNRKER